MSITKHKFRGNQCRITNQFFSLLPVKLLYKLRQQQLKYFLSKRVSLNFLQKVNIYNQCANSTNVCVTFLVFKCTKYSAHFTMATKFRFVAQHVFDNSRNFSGVAQKGQVLSHSRLMDNTYKSKLHSFNLPCVREISDSLKKPDNMQNTVTPKRPFTVVVEGNIGSGKVISYL